MTDGGGYEVTATSERTVRAPPPPRADDKIEIEQLHMMVKAMEEKIEHLKIKMYRSEELKHERRNNSAGY